MPSLSLAALVSAFLIGYITSTQAQALAAASHQLPARQLASIDRQEVRFRRVRRVKGEQEQEQQQGERWKLLGRGVVSTGCGDEVQAVEKLKRQLAEKEGKGSRGNATTSEGGGSFGAPGVLTTPALEAIVSGQSGVGLAQTTSSAIAGATRSLDSPTTSNSTSSSSTVPISSYIDIGTISTQEKATSTRQEDTSSGRAQDSAPTSSSSAGEQVTSSVEASTGAASTSNTSSLLPTSLVESSSGATTTAEFSSPASAASTSSSAFATTFATSPGRSNGFGTLSSQPEGASETSEASSTSSSATPRDESTSASELGIPSSMVEQLKASSLLIGSSNSTVDNEAQRSTADLVAPRSTRDDERPFFSSTTTPRPPTPSATSFTSFILTSLPMSRSHPSETATASSVLTSSSAASRARSTNFPTTTTAPTDQESSVPAQSLITSSPSIGGVGLSLKSTFTLAASDITVSLSSKPPTATPLVTSHTLIPTSRTPTPLTTPAMPSSSAITSGGTSAVAETSVEVGSSSLSEVQSGGAVPMAASGIGMIGESTMGSIDTASVTLASALAPTGSPSAADFVLPGRQLSVLPIGLGVFAGVVAIALTIVGIVTYERKKYRRQFRERRIAEQAQAHLPVARGPGYGTIGAQMREREGVV